MSEGHDRPAQKDKKPTRKERRAIKKQKRFEADDCIVVETKSIRTAIGGTTVGNFME